MADSIARRIKYARELRGISQGEVSRKSGISKGTISGTRTGSRHKHYGSELGRNL